MADPTAFTPGFDYSDFQESNPTTPLPGDEVDSDFHNLETSIASLRAAIMDIRRSDGQLKNGIVSADSLGTSLTFVTDAAEAAALAANSVLALSVSVGLPMPSLPITASATIVNAEHKWRTLRVTQPGVILTLAPTASLEDDFMCQIANAMTNAAVRVKPTTAEFTAFWLKPGQRCTLYRLPDSYVGVDRPLRYRPAGDPNIYCNSGPDGNVNNDGMSPSRPMLTLNAGKNELVNEYDFNGQTPTLYGTGEFTEALAFAQNTLLGYSALNLKGYNNTKFTLNGVGGYGIQIGNNFRLITDYMKVQALATTGWELFSMHQTCVLDVGTNMEFGAAPSGTHISIDTEGKVNFFGNHTISGNCQEHTKQRGHSAIWYAPGTRTMVGTPVMSYLHDIIAAGAEIFYNGTVTTSGASTIAGKGRVEGPSMIYLAGNTLPGTSAVATSHGGECY